MKILVEGIAQGSIYGLFALGIILAHRASHVLNLAHGEIGTFAVLAAAWIVRPFWPWGAVLALAVGAIVGGLVQLVVVARMEEAPRSSVAVATVGLALLLLGIETHIPGLLTPIPSPVGGPGPKFFGYYVGATQQFALAATFIVAVALAVMTRWTDVGLATVAASRDRMAARMVAIPVRVISTSLWSGAGMLAALTMALVAPSLGTIAPGTGTALLLRGVAAAVVGGFEQPFGAIAGGVLVGVIEAAAGHAFVSSSFPGTSTLAVTVVIVGVLLVRPRGILQR